MTRGYDKDQDIWIIFKLLKCFSLITPRLQAVIKVRYSKIYAGEANLEVFTFSAQPEHDNRLFCDYPFSKFFQSNFDIKIENQGADMTELVIKGKK